MNNWQTKLNNSGLGDFYRKSTEKIFKATLNRDIKNKSKYRGYPSYMTMKFAQWSKSTGVKFVDANKGDFTLAPLLNQYSYAIGGKGSVLYNLLDTLNIKLFGGFTDATRFDTQIKFFESYNEYAKSFHNITIIENILAKEIPLYMRKILEEFKLNAKDKGATLKSFVHENIKYFKEIDIYFQFKDKAELTCLADAVEELKARKEAKVRDYLMLGNLANAIFTTVAMILTFGKSLIPSITENFDADISEFSKPVQVVNFLSNFLTDRWYLAVLVAGIIYLIFKTHLVRLIKGYISFKIPVAKDYVINDQLLRFLKSYLNLIESDSVKNSFAQSIKMVDNEYLNFILKAYVDGHGKDIGDTGITFYKVLEDIPYVPKEYTDVIKESEIMGKPEEGIEKVIKIAEPRMEKLVKDYNKFTFWAIMIISGVIGLLLFILLYNDMNRLIEVYNNEFIDRLRN